MIPPHTNRYPKPPSGAATGWGRFFCVSDQGERAAAGGVKPPPYGAKDTWAVMARLRAGHARPLRGAANGLRTRGAREGGSPPPLQWAGCCPGMDGDARPVGTLQASQARPAPLMGSLFPLRGFGGTPDSKVEEGAGALRTDSNTASAWRTHRRRRRRSGPVRS